MTRGADIFEILFGTTPFNFVWFEKKSDPTDAVQKMELSRFPFVFSAEGRATHAHCRAGRRGYMSIGTIILIILIIALLGGFSGVGGGPFYGTGYYGGGGLGLVIVILLILLLLGRI
jgi:hypothetical protein